MKLSLLHRIYLSYVAVLATLVATVHTVVHTRTMAYLGGSLILACIPIGFVAIDWAVRKQAAQTLPD